MLYKAGTCLDFWFVLVNASIRGFCRRTWVYVYKVTHEVLFDGLNGQVSQMYICINVTCSMLSIIRLSYCYVMMGLLDTHMMNIGKAWFSRALSATGANHVPMGFGV